MVAKSTKGSTHADKQSIGFRLRPSVFDVAGDRVTNLLSQRKQRLTPPLPGDANPGLLPVEIAQTKLNDISRPKPQACKQEQNRAISPSNLGSRIT